MGSIVRSSHQGLEVSNSPTERGGKERMIKNIVEKLKEASEMIDERIPSAHSGMRNYELDKLRKARLLVQEAITHLLEEV